MNKTTFESKMASILVDNKFERQVHRQKRGKLDTKSYKNVATSGRCFKRKLSRGNKQYSVSLLLDASGSMGYRNEYGDWLKNESRLGAVRGMVPPLVDTLVNCGVDVEVNAFHSLFVPLCLFGQKPDNIADKYYAAFSMRAYYNEHTNEFGPNAEIGVCDFSCPSYNNDAWAIFQAVERLKDQPGEKILFIFSDGEPAGVNKHFGSAVRYVGDKKPISRYSIDYEVKRASRLGIKVISLGIQTSSVWIYYPKRDTEVVHDLGEMYSAVTKLLFRNIKRG